MGSVRLVMELVGGTERKRFGRARGAGARLARLVISRFFFHSGTEYSAMQAAGSLVEMHLIFCEAETLPKYSRFKLGSKSVKWYTQIDSNKRYMNYDRRWPALVGLLLS